MPTRIMYKTWICKSGIDLWIYSSLELTLSVDCCESKALDTLHSICTLLYQWMLFRNPDVPPPVVLLNAEINSPRVTCWKESRFSIFHPNFQAKSYSLLFTWSCVMFHKNVLIPEINALGQIMGERVRKRLRTMT
jgi:hypothetical protein